jgi:uncharacterized protein YceH (UPF0502 family)
LIEKAKTTPGAYPLTVNSIVTGSNQKNNREPLTAYDDTDVERALDALCTLKVASEIDWMGRVPKYKHHAHEWFGVSRVELAVLAELLLRGAQTLGDLRARAARMEEIADQGALKPIVDGLVARGLMIELTGPGRGQIVSHNLYLAPEREALERLYAGGAPAEAAGARGGFEARAAAPARDAALEEMRAQIAELEERVRALEARLEAAGG